MLRKNGNIYKYELLDNTHLFDKDLMNIQIEGWNPNVGMDFDDIFCVKTSGYAKQTIDHVPNSLEHLEIVVSNLEEIPPFPLCIKYVKILNSKVNMNEDGLQELHQKYPKSFIHISTFEHMGFLNVNEIHHQQQVEIIRQDLQRLNRQDVLPIIANNANPLIANNANPLIANNANPLIANITQTVHLSSINNCIVNAIVIIREESRKHELVKYPVGELFNEPNSFSFKWIKFWFQEIQTGLRRQIQN